MFNLGGDSSINLIRDDIEKVGTRSQETDMRKKITEGLLREPLLGVLVQIELFNKIIRC